MADAADIRNRFEYHAPDETKAETHKRVRQLCLAVAMDLNAMLPEGREKSSAITHLEETMFWANAALARS